MPNAYPTMLEAFKLICSHLKEAAESSALLPSTALQLCNKTTPEQPDGLEEPMNHKGVTKQGFFPSNALYGHAGYRDEHSLL